MANFSIWDAIIGSSPYGRAQQAEAQQQARGQQFSDLQRSYTGQPLTADQAGPQRPLDQGFWQQAAAIPGYQQMASEMMRQQQSQQFQERASEVERQFWTQNERLGDRLNREQQQTQWGNISPFQRANLGLQRRAQDLGQQISPYQQAMLDQNSREQGFRERVAMYGANKPAGAIPGSELFDKQLQHLQSVQSAVGAVGKLGELWSSTPWGRDKEAMGAAEPYRASVMGALGTLQNTGALQEGDVKRYGEMLNEPGIWSSSKRRNAVLGELQKLFMNQVEQVQARNPNLPRSGSGGGGGSSALPDGFAVGGGR